LRGNEPPDGTANQCSADRFTEGHATKKNTADIRSKENLERQACLQVLPDDRRHTSASDKQA
jgi:hypothetical protein